MFALFQGPAMKFGSRYVSYSAFCAVLLVYLAVYSVEAVPTQVFAYHALVCNDSLIGLSGTATYASPCSSSSWINIPSGSGTAFYNISFSGFDFGGNSLVFAFRGFGFVGDVCSSVPADFFFNVNLVTSSAIPVGGSTSGTNVYAMQIELDENTNCGVITTQRLNMFTFDKDGFIVVENSVVVAQNIGVTDEFHLVIDPANGVRAEYWTGGVDTTNTAYGNLGSSIQSVEQIAYIVGIGSGGSSIREEYFFQSGWNFKVQTVSPSTGGQGGILGWLMGGAKAIMGGIVGFVSNAAGGAAGAIWALLTAAWSYIVKTVWPQVIIVLNFIVPGLGSWFNNFFSTIANFASSFYSFVTQGTSFVVKMVVWAVGGLAAWVGFWTRVFSAGIQGVVYLFKYSVNNGIFAILGIIDFLWLVEWARSSGFEGVYSWAYLNFKVVTFPFFAGWFLLWNGIEVVRAIKQTVDPVG